MPVDLKERKKTHGDFTHHAFLTQEFKAILHREVDELKNVRLTDVEREALEMIVHKIGRILAGNPHFQDHWDDIAGYATLVSERIPE